MSVPVAAGSEAPVALDELDSNPSPTMALALDRNVASLLTQENIILYYEHIASSWTSDGACHRGPLHRPPNRLLSLETVGS